MGSEAKQQEVSQLLLELKKLTEADRQRITAELSSLFSKNEQYFDIVMQRLNRVLSESSDLQEKRAALLVICCMPDVLEDFQRTNLINKFHSPVFKLMETNTQESLLERISLAYERIIVLGGNKNDTAIESNLMLALEWIKSASAKQTKKAAALIVIRILLVETPYTTFKKLFQKDNSVEKENYVLLSSVSRSKNIRIRIQYLRFFEEFVKHIAQRRDANFHHSYFNRFYSDLIATRPIKDEQNVHIVLQGLRILLMYAENIFSDLIYDQIIDYIRERKANNKNATIQKSFIAIIPVISTIPKSQILTPKKQQIFFDFLKYLKGIVGEDKVEAYRAIFDIIQSMKSADIQGAVVNEFKLIVLSIKTHLRQRTDKLNLLQRKQTVIIKCMHSIIVKLRREKTEQNFSREEVDDLVTLVLLQGLYEQSVRFVLEMSRFDIYNLSDLIEKKLITIVSKILTANYKRFMDNDVQMETFKVELEKISGSAQFRSEDNRIDAIRSLSIYKFKQQYMGVVSTFVRDKIIKHYLEWKIGDTRKAAVEAAFLLYAKKGKRVAQNQMTEILEKILNVGMSDPDQQVKKTVFNCLKKNLSASEGFSEFLNVQSHFRKLFECLKDRNIIIQNITLEILCRLSEDNPSDIVPFLKKILYQFLRSLSKMDHSSYHEKKNILKLLRCIIQHGTSIIQAHTPAICRIMIGYLKDKQHSQVLSQYIFKTFQILTQHLAFSTMPYIDDLTQFQLEAMQDKLNSKRRSIAVKSFISVIRNCGYVILPYCKFPNLLPTVVYLVKGGIDTDGRLDLLKILGGLGAIDRFRYKVLSKVYEEHGDEGIKSYLAENKTHCYYLQNEKLAREKQRTDNPINELKHYYEDLIVLGITSKKQVALSASPVVNSTLVPNRREKQQSIPSRDINELTINSLLRILEDPSLNKKHPLTIEALSKIVDLLGTALEKYTKSLIPRLLKLSSENTNVMKVVLIVTQNCNLGDYAEDVLKYVVANTNSPQLTEISLDILEIFAYKFRSSLRHSLQSIIHMSNKFIKSKTTRKVTVKIFNIYKYLEELLDPHIHLILPFFCDNFLTTVSDLTDDFLELLVSFAQKCSSTIEYLSLITQYLVNLLKITTVRKDAMAVTRSKIINTFVAFVLLFKESFVVYLPLIHKTIQTGPENGLYNKCMRYIQNRANLEQITDFFSQEELMFILSDSKQPIIAKQQNQRLTKKPEGLENLINEFDPTQKNQIDEDWNEWLRKTSLELLKKSPSPILKSCASLAEQYLELAAELYNVAFLQIWLILQSDQKHKMIYHIKRVLSTNPPPPLNVRQTILNLTEFMGRQNYFSELEPEFLAKAAKDALAYAKTLYFCEQLFELNPERQMQVLIEIYTLLGQPQSAAGLLKIAKKHKIQTKVSWHQKLQHYQQAIEEYNKSGNKNQDIVPKIKCFNEMGDWKLVLQSCTKLSEDKGKRKDVADLAVNATINLGRWDQAREWIDSVDPNNENLQFWNAMLSLKKEDYDEAEKHIKASRLLIYNQISQLLTFSSNHSADSLIRLQQLFELEQIIGIKRFEKAIIARQNAIVEPAPQFQVDLQRRITSLKEIWSDRLMGNTRSLVVWQKILCVRSLMFSKSEEIDFWLDFCKLALKEHKYDICKSTLDSIKVELSGKHQNNRVVELQMLELEYKFRSGIMKQDDAIKRVEHFLERNTEIDSRLKAKMYYKCAIWVRQREEEEINVGRTDQILELINKCTVLNPKLIKGWHLLGVMHSQVLQTFKSEANALQALKAFFKSLELGTRSHKYFLQDCLKLMTLVFEHSEDKKISDEFRDSFRRVVPEGWIDVIPQIIARLYTKNKRSNNLSNLLRQLLLYVGEQHPQALIYPLIFASKSKTKDRRQPALAILKKIQQKDGDICTQAELISTQLGKAAIKLKQFWHDGIDAAWKIYDESKNIGEVVKMLKELHENDRDRPIKSKSNSEISFEQEFGLELKEAYQWLLRFEKTGEVICFSQAFEIYFSIYRRIKQSFENLKKVYLKNVAPVLLSVSDCKLSMPGLYNPNKPIVCIQGFHNELVVLQSKQRPRKLLIYGSDGKEYTFLLKGRQDLRLDERVMQLLGLVNKLLGLNHSTLKKDLFITRYSIIPLSVNTGLIGWVEECDTLNELIKEYRTDHRIRPDVEKNLYEKFCDQYTQLPMINKVEIFRHVLESTQGLDLAKVLWLKSANSEAWIERRTCYTRSLATMSMVGYILGLGDRHPSNIMIQRKTGRIVHIDFGDCFEVAMLRDKFPEKVPFRLTRMLQKAMEVCGIEGNYKSTCETVMNVLRSNKESLLIVLEAFLYDPIISWKLNVNNAPKAEAPITEEKQQDHPFPDDKGDGNEMLMSILQGFSNKQFKEKTQLEQQKKPQPTPGRLFKPDNEPPEQISQKAKYTLDRIRKKLYGRDFDESKILNVVDQVERLIKEAKSYQNICQSWIGWCPFW